MRGGKRRSFGDEMPEAGEWGGMGSKRLDTLKRRTVVQTMWWVERHGNESPKHKRRELVSATAPRWPVWSSDLEPEVVQVQRCDVRCGNGSMKYWKTGAMNCPQDASKQLLPEGCLSHVLKRHGFSKYILNCYCFDCGDVYSSTFFISASVSTKTFWYKVYIAFNRFVEHNCLCAYRLRCKCYLRWHSVLAKAKAIR